MSSASQTLKLAIQHHRTGNLPMAEQLYLRVLESEPQNADVHHLLGMATLVQGQATRAVEHFEQAVRYKGQSAEYRHHLGVALGIAGRKPEAIEMLRQTLAIEPRSAAIHNDLAGLLRETQQMSEAEICFREAIRLDPALVEAHNNLGNLLLAKREWTAAQEVLQSALVLRPQAVEVQFNLGICYQGQGRWAEAEAAYRDAIALRPNLAGAYLHLGGALLAQQRFAESVASYREAIQLDPKLVDAQVGLATALQAMEQFVEAEQWYRRVLELRPDLTALYNLSGALFAQHRYIEAADCLRRVLERNPGEPELHFRLGQCLQFEGRFTEAIASHDRAIEAQPENAEYHYFRATTWLTSGDFERGWPEYEWRLKTKYAGPAYPQPRWQGEDLQGKRIIVYAEWGLGDTLHFIRYLPMVRQRGGDVFLAVQPSLIPLLEESGFTQLLPLRADAAPQCQWQVPLLSLAGIFHTNLENIHAGVPYLSASPRRIESWRERLGRHDGLSIGIHWHGSNSWSLDARSIPLADFEPLSRVPGVRLISLQKSGEDKQLQQLDGRFPIVDFGEQLDADGGAFMDTAAIMKNLDLVITCDTSTAHVAGALGVPVWVVLPRASEWRWMWDREDTPWYPTMRLFRQRRSNDWAEVFQRIADELAQEPRADRVTTVSEALAMATALHERGELVQAQAIYGQIVSAEPQHAEVWHRLGVLRHQLGRHADAAEAILRAIALDDGQAAYHNHLGAVYAALADFEKSEASFRRALALAASDPQIHYNLAALLNLRGRHGESIEHYRRAIELNPRMAEAHFNLGNLLRDRGDWSQAEASYASAAAARPRYTKAMMGQATAQWKQGKLERAKEVWRQVIDLDPSHVEAHVRLGSLLQSQGAAESAIVHLRTAVQLDPRHVEAQNNLGCCYRAAGQLDLAEQCFRLALASDADCFEAQVNLGSLLHATKEYVDAAACLERALAVNPSCFDAHNCLGIVRQSQQRYDEAVEHYRRAIELEPDSADALANLGSCLRQQGKIDEAIPYLRRAIAIDATQHHAHSSLGQCLQIQGKFDEALASYDRALAIKPEEPDYHYFRASLWLTTGDFVRGWPEYESRLKTVNGASEFPARRWRGEPLRGERILVYTEWGLGDTLHFARYVPMVRERGGDVVFLVQPGLIPLLEESGFEQVVPLSSRDPGKYQWQAPLLSLPAVFGTTLETIPTAVPYLRARPTLVEHWRQRLGGCPGLRVGIFWQGRMAWAADPRSIPLAEFEPLARVKGVTLVSLQKRETAEQLHELAGRFPVTDFGDELDASGGAFMDTAAIMKNLDLVVTCDTSTAHVAGALGVPVWVALPRASEWRWMSEREDTPWYPTMRLFRQRPSGNWSDVFERMAERLGALVVTAGC